MTELESTENRVSLTWFSNLWRLKPIEISRGPRNEKAPTFSAYMWAPDPEADDKGMTEPKVA